MTAREKALPEDHQSDDDQDRYNADDNDHIAQCRRGTTVKVEGQSGPPLVWSSAMPALVRRRLALGALPGGIRMR